MQQFLMKIYQQRNIIMVKVKCNTLHVSFEYFFPLSIEIRELRLPIETSKETVKWREFFWNIWRNVNWKCQSSFERKAKKSECSFEVLKLKSLFLNDNVMFPLYFFPPKFSNAWSHVCVIVLFAKYVPFCQLLVWSFVRNFIKNNN